MTESAVLAAVGCIAGGLLTAAGSRAVIAAAAGGSLAVTTATDAAVLLFTAVLTISTVLCFGLLPAIRGSRAELASVTRGGRLATSVHASGARVPVGRLLIPLQVDALARTARRRRTAEPEPRPPGRIRSRTRSGPPAGCRSRCRQARVHWRPLPGAGRGSPQADRCTARRRGSILFTERSL